MFNADPVIEVLHMLNASGDDYNITRFVTVNGYSRLNIRAPLEKPSREFQ